MLPHALLKTVDKGCTLFPSVLARFNWAPTTLVSASPLVAKSPARKPAVRTFQGAIIDWSGNTETNLQHALEKIEPGEASRFLVLIARESVLHPAYKGSIDYTTVADQSILGYT